MSKDLLYPLRCLHGRIYEWNETRKQGQQLQKYLLKSDGVRAIIPGTPLHLNLGDSAIALAQAAFLQKCGFSADRVLEISFQEYSRYHKQIQKAIRKTDLITQLGGGNMGSQWKEEEDFHRQVVKDFPSNPMFIFPQTIHYSSTESGEAEKQASVSVYNGRKNLTIVAREQTSYGIMSSLYPDTPVLLTPDIVLSATMDTFGVKPQPRSGVLLCMRSDAERSMSDDTRTSIEHAVEVTENPFRYMDMYSDCPVTKENRTDCVRRKMEEFAAAKLVITDRLHGMVFAAITETPCIVFSNYNHKVRGTYEWIKQLPYIRYAESAEDVEKYLPELLAMKNCKYDNAPLLPYFEKLAMVVKEIAQN